MANIRQRIHFISAAVLILAVCVSVALNGKPMVRLSPFMMERPERFYGWPFPAISVDESVLQRSSVLTGAWIKSANLVACPLSIILDLACQFFLIMLVVSKTERFIRRRDLQRQRIKQSQGTVL